MSPALLRHRLIVLFHEPPVFKTKRFVSAMASRVEDSKDRGMITAEHTKVVDSCCRVGQTPLCIGKGSIEALERWRGTKSFIRPCVSWATVTQIDESTSLNMVTRGINTSKIRPTRT